MVRQARAGSRWTSARPQQRRDYDAFMASPAWAARRAMWHKEERDRTGESTRCAVCGSQAEIQLHHLDYTRRGREEHSDLVPLCAAHHKQLHDVWDVAYQWRRMGRRAGSMGIIASMRSQRRR